MDVPWEFDAQRENPKQRAELLIQYEKELILYKKRYIKIEGSKEERLSNVLSFLENL